MTIFSLTTLLLGCAPKKSPAPTKQAWIGELAMPSQGVPVLSDSLLDLGSATVELRGEPFQSLYKKIAPKTVIVHSGDGYGSGVLVDKKGFILTNDHVVFGGKWDADLNLNVQVEFGSMNDRGMVRTSKKLAAKVIKRDPHRDLALVKLIELPAHKLKPIKIAKKPPETGQAVAALGHAKIGMFWAMKQCDVAAVGKAEQDLAKDIKFDEQTENGRLLRLNNASVVNQIKSIDGILNSGYVLQTNCDIFQGDSGGPLIDEKGSLVGLNSFGIDGRALNGLPQVAAYHVDIEEIIDFLKEVPESSAWIPDIWKSNGPLSKLKDEDGDGSYDTLFLGGNGGYTKMIDLDLDSPVAELETLVQDRLWDAELVTIQKRDQPTYHFYDTNNDKTFDRVLVYFPDEDTCSFSDIGPNNQLSLQPIEDCWSTKIEWFTDAKVIAAINDRKLLSGQIKNPKTVPSFDISKSAEIDFGDIDGDGVDDFASIENYISIRGVSTLSSKTDIQTALTEGKELDFGLIIVGEYGSGQQRWHAYNTGTASGLDLVVFNNSWSLGPFVDKAWRRNGGVWEIDSSFIGSSMIGAYNKNPKKGRNLFSVITEEPIAETPFPSQYPYPVVMDDYAEIRRITKGGPTEENPDAQVKTFSAMVNHTDWGRYVSVDLDHDSGDAVKPGEMFDGEVVVIESAKYKWLWYDSENDGTYDTMILSSGNNNLLRVVEVQDNKLVDSPNLMEAAKKHLLVPAIFEDVELQNALQLFH